MAMRSGGDRVVARKNSVCRVLEHAVAFPRLGTVPEQCSTVYQTLRDLSDQLMSWDVVGGTSHKDHETAPSIVMYQSAMPNNLQFLGK